MPNPIERKPALSLVQPNIIVDPIIPAADTSSEGINTNALDACGPPTNTGTFEQVDTWETGFMGRISVQINALSPGWSVLLTFDEPIAIGNVQVFNARYTQISRDSRTVLFVSKTAHNGGSIPLPNFGFVFTEMPSWSPKPVAGKVLFYNKIIYDDDCIDGKSGGAAGPSFQQTAFQQQAAQQPVQVAFNPPPRSTTAPTTQPTTRPMSLMERLAAKRQGLLTTPPPQIIVDDPEPPPTPAPGYAIANNAGGGTSGNVQNIIHKSIAQLIRARFL